jgi:hypothetical protein
MTNRTALVVFAVAVVLAGVPTSASGQTETQSATQSPNIEVRGQLGASINNAGLQQTLDVVWTRPIARSAHPLLSGARVAIGGTSAITPSQARLGAWLEVSPLSILDFRAGFEPSLYFGTFDSLMGFGEYDEPFDPDARRIRGGAGPGLSSRSYLAPTLKYKAGPIVASSSLGLEWWRSNVEAPYFYEPTRDTLISANSDRLTTMTNLLLYEIGETSAPLRFGAYHSLTDVSEAPANRIQKLGAVVTKQFASTHLGVPRPSVTVLVGKYLEDHYKKGEWTAAVAIGFKR